MSKIDKSMRALLGASGLYEEWAEGVYEVLTESELGMAPKPKAPEGSKPLNPGAFKTPTAVSSGASDHPRNKGRLAQVSKGVSPGDMSKIMSRKEADETMAALRRIAGIVEQTPDPRDPPYTDSCSSGPRLLNDAVKKRLTALAHPRTAKQEADETYALIRLRMGLDEAKYCGCGCGGEGHCAAIKNAQQQFETARAASARTSKFQEMVNEGYDEDFRELRRAAGILSEQYDNMPPGPGPLAPRQHKSLRNRKPLW